MGRKQKEIMSLSIFAVSANIDRDIKLLGIPAMENKTGAAQYDALAKVLEDYGMCDYVKGLCLKCNCLKYWKAFWNLY